MQGTIAVSDGSTLWTFRYSTQGRSRTLFHSVDIPTIREMYPDAERLALFGDDAHVVVSEPLNDLPGTFVEVPGVDGRDPRPGRISPPAVPRLRVVRVGQKSTEFLDGARATLAAIPGVRNIVVNRQVSPKSDLRHQWIGEVAEFRSTTSWSGECVTRRG